MNNGVNVNVGGADALVPCTYKTVVLKQNIVGNANLLTQQMMSQRNTKYVIKYDYVIDPSITHGTAAVSASNVSHCVNPAYSSALAAYNEAHDAWIDADNAYTNDPNETTLAAKNAAYAAYSSAQTALGNTPQYYYYAGTAINVKQGRHISIPEGCVLLNSSLSGLAGFDIAPSTQNVYIGSLVAGGYDYTVQNAIVLPAGCLIEFDGGSISDGTLVGNLTILICNQELDDIMRDVVREGTFVYNNTLSADEEDLTEKGNILQFKDRPNIDGMGRIILRKNKSFASQLTQANTIYEIRYDFDINDPNDENPVTIPANCVLKFDGGSLSNGTIIGNHTYIDSKTLCIKKDITIGGTWDNDIIYTRWFEFLSTNDGTTDNLLAFKQVQSMANGVGKVKIEFEPDLYLQSSIPQLVHSNAHRYNGTESILYFDQVDYVEINLNGSTIKLLDNDSVWTNIICVSRTNAVIKNGHLTGNADTNNYPEYTKTDGTTGYSYEWGYGVCLIGGTLIVENVAISYCKGDGINAGSWWIYPEGDLENSVVGNYMIENCEVSYTGRNGMAFKSSDYGIVRNCKIHHIGTYGTVRGWNPKAGIDIEFTDIKYVEGYTPDLDFSNLYISDCEKHAIVTANIAYLGTPVKSFSLKDSHIRGALSLSNLNGGDVTIANNIIEPRKNDGVHSVFTNQTFSNCRFILNTFIYPSNGVFENCKFIQPEEFTIGTVESVLYTDPSIVTAPKFTDCEFDVFRVNFTDALLTGCIVHFKIDKSNNSIRTEYINTTITGTTNTTRRTRIIFNGGNGVNVTHLSHCVLKNLGNTDGASDGLRFEDPTIIENSTIEDCDFRILDYDVNIRNCSGSNIYLRTPDATKPGKCIFSESVFKNVTISGGFTGDGKTTIINSEIELANDLTAQNILLYNSVLTAIDKPIKTSDSYHPTITAYESILNIGEYVCWQIKLIKSIYKKVNGGWDNGNNGGSASRPVGSDIYVGFVYFDTTLGKPIYASAISGVGVKWVDAAGTILTWPVTYTLTGITTSNTASPIVDTPYTTTLSAKEGFSLPPSITVKMGNSTLSAGTDYTYDQSTGEVVILGIGGTGGVTGDLEIIASGVKA